MKKKDFSELDDDLRPEHRPEDFAGLRVERGRFAKALRRGSSVVRIAPDVHAAFHNERAVNAALRGLLRKRPRSAAKTGRRR
jgi:hypothetical protein